MNAGTFSCERFCFEEAEWYLLEKRKLAQGCSNYLTIEKMEITCVVLSKFISKSSETLLQ